MYKQGAVIYFSATGNTKYIAKQLQDEFGEKNIKLDLIDIQKRDNLDIEYDFYIFGSAIHADMFPVMYIKWIKENIKNENKKCIIYSTLADSEDRKGRIQLAKILHDKGLHIIVSRPVTMPTNYAIGIFSQESEEDINNKIQNSKSIVSEIVDDFINEKRSNININESILSSKVIFDMFNIYSKTFAKKKFSLDKDKCINCKICELQCPTNNIILKDKSLYFNKKCISCMRCIHRCPTNAILYNKKPFKQYVIEEYTKTLG